jgi:hypothetical protein
MLVHELDELLGPLLTNQASVAPAAAATAAATGTAAVFRDSTVRCAFQAG